MTKGYFDYNATTPLSDNVQKSVMRAMPLFANPSSKYTFGTNALTVVQEARSNMATLMGCNTDEIYFTSGGTESNNLAIRSVLDRFERPALRHCHVITTAIEHSSILAVLRWYAARFDLQVTYVRPDSQGRVSLESIENEITSRTRLVTAMAVNNETGVIQPYREIAELASRHGIPCHIDAVQAIGKIPWDCSGLAATTVSFSGHKFYSPKGVGGLYCNPYFTVSPLLFGGGQEKGVRNGTENTLGLAGLATSAMECHTGLQQDLEHYECLRSLAFKLLDQCQVKYTCNGSTDPEHQAPWTINISLEGIRAEAIAARLDLCHGIAVSLGSACSNNKVQRRSHVLTAMGLTEQQIDSAIRISFGRFTTEEDINHLVTSIALEAGQLATLASSEREELAHEAG